MKKILFVVNTMGRAGAETALIELLNVLNVPDHKLYLYVIMGQGEMIEQLPSHVTLLNSSFSSQSVLTRKGKRAMVRTIWKAFFRNGGYFRKLGSVFRNAIEMKKKGKFQFDKLLWRVLSEGGQRFQESFDLAVAYLEGASAYYVADHVKARRKAAFIHIDYPGAGYTRKMDQGCWDRFDRIFGVSGEVREHFLSVYPEYEGKTGVFHNIVNQETIRLRARESGGFSDGYKGTRLLTVGRLTWQKAYDIAIGAMKLLKEAGYPVRWYVLGEGDQRKKLEKQIGALGLSEDFVLLGAVKNPFPYYTQADLYIHATRFEGKSIAIQEAQTLGCPVIASDCNGNREQIVDGQDGILCELTPEAIAASVVRLLNNEEERKRLGRTAAEKSTVQDQELKMLLELLA